ncbi:MAG: ABC transporter substrate-binding protein [Clostridiaceae bacterium]
MKNVKKLVSLLCAGVLAAGIFTGCAKKEVKASAESSSRIEEIKKNGKLVLATGDYRPFEYHDEKTNKVVGYDIDIAQKVADKIGVPLEVKDMAFTSLIPTIQNGQADLVIAALYITDERKQVIDFADPYLKSGQIIVTDKNSSINTSKDLEGKKVGAKFGATSAAVVQGLIDKGAKIQLVTYKTNEEMLADLEIGRLDAGINDKLYQLQYNSTHPSLTIHDEVLKEAELGIGVKKGDTGLIEVVNEVLKELKDSGEADSIYKKWIPAQK